MHMHVDEPWRHNLLAHVNHLGRWDGQVLAHLLDDAVDDEEIRYFINARHRVENRTAFEKDLHWRACLLVDMV